MPTLPTLRGVSRLQAAIDARTKRLTDAPPERAIGIVQDDYSLAVPSFADGGGTPFRLPLGEWYLDERLSLPEQLMTTTPDGVTGYYSHAAPPAEGGAVVVGPDEEGAHDHHVVGLHSHSFSGGDPQGGSVSGTTSADAISIDATDEASPVAGLPYEGHHHHAVLTPPQLRPLMPGDKVMCFFFGSAVIVEYRIVNSLDAFPLGAPRLTQAG